MNGVGRYVSFVIAIAFGLFAGCSQSGPKYVTVSGKVTLKDGTPVKHGNIIFQPDQKRGNASQVICQSVIRDGEYTIRTGEKVGAPLGTYRVLIEAPLQPDEKNPYFTKWFAHEKYMNPERSKLTVDVAEQPEPGQYDFKLDPPIKRK